MLSLLISIALLGLVVWAVNQYVPMAPMFKNVFNIVAIVVLIVIVGSAFGLWSGVGALPRIR